MPSSPTMSRGRRVGMLSPSTSLYASSGFLGYSQGSNLPRPTTPTRSSGGLLDSMLTMTPLAKRNLTITPSRTTGKSKATRSINEDVFSDNYRSISVVTVPKTPSKRPAEPSTSGALETPRKVSSPFNTFSPFRALRRTGIPLTSLASLLLLSISNRILP